MASDGCMCTTLTVSQQICPNSQPKCKSLNKGKLRNIFVLLGSPLAIIPTFQWAFCLISSVKSPTLPQAPDVRRLPYIATIETWEG